MSITNNLQVVRSNVVFSDACNTKKWYEIICDTNGDKVTETANASEACGLYSYLNLMLKI